MTITNGYCSSEQVLAAVGLKNIDDYPEIEVAVETAARQIDAHCGRRRFWQDGSVVARTYYPSESRRVYVDDISTTTGLVVKVDLDDDGTFETTLTINTDFVVEPINAGLENPVRPYESIRLLDGTITSFSRLSSGRPFVQVTAKFGWPPSVPMVIRRANELQAKTVWKAVQAQDGLTQTSIDGQVIRMPALDPMVRLSLEPFIRYSPVDDDGC